MSRQTKERRLEIVQIALTAGRVDVVELSRRFGVSEVTIRTDLNVLSKRGTLSRTRGGAVASERIPEELSIPQREGHFSRIKHALAERACQFISNGDSLVLDSGSTTAEIARRLGQFKRLNVITNGLNVAQILNEHEGIEVIVTGGTE